VSTLKLNINLNDGIEQREQSHSFACIVHTPSLVSHLLLFTQLNWQLTFYRASYASAVLGVVILSVRLSHACFVTNPIFIPHERAIFLVF